jgi:hypothetical protein
MRATAASRDVAPRAIKPKVAISAMIRLNLVAISWAMEAKFQNLQATLHFHAVTFIFINRLL